MQAHEPQTEADRYIAPRAIVVPGGGTPTLARRLRKIVQVR
jgi:hypothetical protein